MLQCGFHKSVQPFAVSEAAFHEHPSLSRLQAFVFNSLDDERLALWMAVQLDQPLVQSEPQVVNEHENELQRQLHIFAALLLAVPAYQV